MAEKAWLTSASILGPGSGLFRAPTASKARYLAYLNFRDVWPSLPLTAIRVRRAKEYDHYTFRDGIMPEYADPPVPEPLQEVTGCDV